MADFSDIQASPGIQAFPDIQASPGGPSSDPFFADPGRDIRVMGILNLSPDSFYAPSRLEFSILESGADIIDVGAVSTRPGAAPVSEEEEWHRLESVLREISQTFPHLAGIPSSTSSPAISIDSVQTASSATFPAISIDTTRAGIIERACDLLGAPVIVNDISAGEDDPAMLPLAGRLGLQYIAMHKRGTPLTMQTLCDYDDVISEVSDYFRRFSLRAAEAGVSDWILDPGFGFAKDASQCFRLLSGLGQLRVAGHPVLVGISRKSFIYNTLGISPEEALPATSALHLAALERGADILRVHDVRSARGVISLYRSLHGVQ